MLAYFKECAASFIFNKNTGNWTKWKSEAMDGRVQTPEGSITRL